MSIGYLLIDLSSSTIEKFALPNVAPRRFEVTLSMLAIHRRYTRDPIKQIAKLCQFQPATYYIAGTIRDKIVDTFTFLTHYFVPVIPSLPSLHVGLSFQLPFSPNNVVRQLLKVILSSQQATLNEGAGSFPDTCKRPLTFHNVLVMFIVIEHV